MQMYKLFSEIACAPTMTTFIKMSESKEKKVEVIRTMPLSYNELFSRQFRVGTTKLLCHFPHCSECRRKSVFFYDDISRSNSLGPLILLCWLIQFIVTVTYKFEVLFGETL